jgi:hypothetical protein
MSYFEAAKERHSRKQFHSLVGFANLRALARIRTQCGVGNRSIDSHRHFSDVEQLHGSLGRPRKLRSFAQLGARRMM